MTDMTDRQIRIVSDGTAYGTKVFGPDGNPITRITRLEILPIEPGGTVTAVVTFSDVTLDVVCQNGIEDKNG